MPKTAPDDSKTLTVNYRVTAVEYGTNGSIYRCKAIGRAPSGWSALVLPANMVPGGVMVGHTLAVTGLERRRRRLRVFLSVERTISGVTQS